MRCTSFFMRQNKFYVKQFFDTTICSRVEWINSILFLMSESINNSRDQLSIHVLHVK
jgi:hypothetical protein